MEHINKYRSLDDYGIETVDIIIEREFRRIEDQKNRLLTYNKAIKELQNNIDES